MSKVSPGISPRCMGSVGAYQQRQTAHKYFLFMGFFQGNPGMFPLRDTHVVATRRVIEAAQIPGIRPLPPGRTPTAHSSHLSVVLPFAVPLIAALGVV